jgi:hypothetical protein
VCPIVAKHLLLTGRWDPAPATVHLSFTRVG